MSLRTVEIVQINNGKSFWSTYVEVVIVINQASKRAPYPIEFTEIYGINYSFRVNFIKENISVGANPHAVVRGVIFQYTDVLGRKI